jgi:RimJ/RimL family protein N-acetyltransferase
MADADEVFACISAVTARFMRWETPTSLAEYRARREAWLKAGDRSVFAFVIRRMDSMECLGIAGIDEADQPMPELGIWLKETAYGQGYGTEAVSALATWATEALGKTTFLYPVAEENVASRRIAEKLNGKIIGTRSNPKYQSVVYKICTTKP